MAHRIGVYYDAHRQLLCLVICCPGFNIEVAAIDGVERNLCIDLAVAHRACTRPVRNAGGKSHCEAELIEIPSMGRQSVTAEIIIELKSCSVALVPSIPHWPPPELMVVPIFKLRNAAE